MKTIVVIPARGSSKRFPGKNLALLGGKPLLAWPIEAAKKAKTVERVIVSTDDEGIAAVAKEHGADVIIRPPELATDTSPVVEAIKHVIGELEHTPDYIVLLQPTTPLIEPEQIDAAAALAEEKQADSVVNVAEVDTINHPYNVREVQADGIMHFWQEDLHYRVGKDRPKFYKAANLWLSSRDTILSGKLEGKKNYPILVPAKYASDIDTEDDLAALGSYVRSRQTQK